MARVAKMVPLPVAAVPAGEPVAPVSWRPFYDYFPPPLAQEEIGRYDRPPLSAFPAMAPQLQRRSGWPAGNTSWYWPYVMPPWQKTQQVASYAGTQRNNMAVGSGNALSRLKVHKMRAAIKEAAVAQSGAQVVPFLQAVTKHPSG